MELQCAKCGTYWPAGRMPGSICGVGDPDGRICNGNLLPLSMLNRQAAPVHRLDIKCGACGGVFSSSLTGRQIGDDCPIPACYGMLDRYWG